MRSKLVSVLAYAWRAAETHYLQTDSDSWKRRVAGIQHECGLSKSEQKLLEQLTQAMGV